MDLTDVLDIWPFVFKNNPKHFLAKFREFLFIEPVFSFFFASLIFPCDNYQFNCVFPSFFLPHIVSSNFLPDPSPPFFCRGSPPFWGPYTPLLHPVVLFRAGIEEGTVRTFIPPQMGGFGGVPYSFQQGVRWGPVSFPKGGTGGSRTCYRASASKARLWAAAKGHSGCRVRQRLCQTLARAARIEACQGSWCSASWRPVSCRPARHGQRGGRGSWRGWCGL